MLISGIEAMRSTGATGYGPWYLSNVAAAHADRGMIADARRYADEALAAAAVSMERWCEAEVHRMAGEIALISQHGGTAIAAPHFKRALSVARAQGARSLELRAAMSMARIFFLADGETDQARDLLAGIYCGFSEGFDTPDLRRAKAMMDSQSSLPTA